MIRFRPMYVEVSVVVSAAPVRRTNARARASVASNEIRTTKGVSFRGFVTSFFRTLERSSTGSYLPPVSTFRTMPSSTFKTSTTNEVASQRCTAPEHGGGHDPQGCVRRRWRLHQDVDGWFSSTFSAGASPLRRRAPARSRVPVSHPSPRLRLHLRTDTLRRCGLSSL